MNSPNAYLDYGTGEVGERDLYYATGLETPSPFAMLYEGDGTISILVSPLEYELAKQDSNVDNVINTHELMDETLKHHDNPMEELLKKFVKSRDVERVGIPEDFPYKKAKYLEKNLGRTVLDVLRPGKPESITVVESPFKKKRKTKSELEQENLKEAQKFTENMMKEVEKILSDSVVRNGVVFYKDSKLTSERFKSKIKKKFLEHSYSWSEEPVISSGQGTVKPHESGSGPILEGEPILVDLFPYNDTTKYFGDMSRTFVKGAIQGDLRNMGSACKEAIKSSIETIEPGVTCKELSESAIETLESHGYEYEPESSEGLIHSLGHGIGLDLHEQPSISPSSDDSLDIGAVVTIEPGLYYKDIGGVRIEDMICVSEDGPVNFNTYKYGTDGIIEIN